MTAAPAAPSRVGYVGASDVGAILGVDPHRSPLDVWMRVVGLDPGGEETKATKRGKRLEDYVLDEYAAENGFSIIAAESMRDTYRPWFGGTPDALVTTDRTDPEAPLWGVDAKTASGWVAEQFGREWTDEVPPQYLAQAQVYLYLTGYDRWDVAALIGGRTFEFRFFKVERDEEFIALALAHVDAFWHDHVETGVPPSGTIEARQKFHKLKFRGSRLPPLRSDAESVQLALRALQHAEQERDAAAGAYAEARLAVESILGEHESLICPGVGTVTWRSTASGSRVFRTNFQGAER